MPLHTVHHGNHILYDGCPRCEEHANKPLLDLDQNSLDALVELMLTKPLTFGDRNSAGDFYSENEVIACRNIQAILNQAAKVRLAAKRLERKRLLDAIPSDKLPTTLQRKRS